MRILIVEDDIQIAKDLIGGLSKNNFICTHVMDGQQGYELAIKHQYQLIITDLMLPIMNGLELISKLRNNNLQTPVLILTAKRSLDEKVLGLQSGGDDYLVKPYAFVELLARVQNLIRRSIITNNSDTVTEVCFLDLKINLISREVFRKQQKIELQNKEFKLLEFFIKNQNTPLTKNQILEKVWGYSFDPQTNVVDVLVYRLRGKINKDFEKSYIHTIKGIGYVLKIE